jgi:hypothetical protein
LAAAVLVDQAATIPYSAQLPQPAAARAAITTAAMEAMAVLAVEAPADFQALLALEARAIHRLQRPRRGQTVAMALPIATRRAVAEVVHQP